jgi:hypothetical protein
LEADIADFRLSRFPVRFRRVCRNSDNNYFIINILINAIMAQTFLLGAGKADGSKLFSTVTPTLEQCRAKRDKWLNEKN